MNKFNMNNKNYKKNKSQKGFVILFAVLISSLVLSVSISIISISIKQIILSGSGRDSQYAFYASNSGAECAQYWDYAGFMRGDEKISIFATSSESNLNFDITKVTCLGRQLVLNNDNGGKTNSPCNTDINTDTGWCVDSTVTSAKTKFRIQYDGKPYCADVIVSKSTNSSGNASTTITSRGYNTCVKDNLRRIERALEFSY